MSGLFKKLCWWSKLIRVVSEHYFNVCGLQPQSLFLSVCLPTLTQLPPWRKFPQTGYELIPEYVFSLNLWRYNQEWSQSEIFYSTEGDKMVAVWIQFWTCIFISTTSPKIQSALWSMSNLSPYLVKICLPAVFILNRHQELIQRLFCRGCCLTDVFFPSWG